MTLRRNTLVNLVGQGLGVLISLATVPPLLRLIGDARYGVLLLVWLLLGYFGLFDLGVSQATTQRMATLRDAAPSERAHLLWTALAMNGGMGVAAGVILYGAGWYVLGRYVGMEEGLRAESLRALPWIALALPVNLIASAFTGALQGREAFASVTVTSTLGQLLSQCLPLAVAWRGHTSLEVLIPAALLARFATAVLVAALARVVVPLAGRPVFDSALGKGLLSYGSWATVSAIVGPVMSSLDRVVIAGISGSQAVTYYGVPQGLAARLLMLPSALSGALFPRLAATAPEQRDALAEVSVRTLAAVMTPAVLVGLFLAGPFLRVWISADFAAKATSTAQVVLLGVWMNGLALVAFSSLQAQGRPDRIARLHLAELPVYLGLLAGALHLWGVVGAAIAWTARMTADAVLLFAMSGYLSSIGRKLLIPAGLVCSGLLLLRILDGRPWFTWPAGALLLGAACVWSWAVIPWWLVRRRGNTPSGDR